MTKISFPKELLFGTSTAAYQIEGAYDEDGRGFSIWDTYCRVPNKVLNGENGDIACDSYHRMDEDIELLKELDVEIYRFSISWSRILPDGFGKVNQKGIDHYHEFLDKLLAAGIKAVVTLYHWDLPQKLQDIGGWTNRIVADYFSEYADILFKEYGSKVDYWLTINEPWCAAFLGYYSGEQAPGMTGLQHGIDAAHTLMLAHGKAVQKFRKHDFSSSIGYAPNYMWYEPFSKAQEDLNACKLSAGWFLEWFTDPIFKGRYPNFLLEWFSKKGVSPVVKPGDMEIISTPIDFLGVNYYTGSVARFKEGQGLFDTEQVDVDFKYNDIGMKIFPEGFYKILLKIKSLYGDIPIMITENGLASQDSLKDGVVDDLERQKYLMQHLTELNRAIKSGVRIIGYCCWSLMDNFEWSYGYSKRFGLVFVDYETLERTKKNSFYWYRTVAKNHQFEINDHETRV